MPLMNHRESWALEEMSPSLKDFQAEVAGEKTAAPASTSSTGEVLVVASKLKDYIRIKSGMNTSGSVLEILSDKVRIYCDQAIERAKLESRKTVLDRDFLRPS